MNDDKWTKEWKKWRDKYYVEPSKPKRKLFKNEPKLPKLVVNKDGIYEIRGDVSFLDPQGYTTMDWPKTWQGSWNDGCNHDFKEYYGFNDAFKYCTKCDKKEKL